MSAKAKTRQTHILLAPQRHRSSLPSVAPKVGPRCAPSASLDAFILLLRVCDLPRGPVSPWESAPDHARYGQSGRRHQTVQACSSSPPGETRRFINGFMILLVGGLAGQAMASDWEAIEGLGART